MSESTDWISIKFGIGSHHQKMSLDLNLG